MGKFFEELEKGLKEVIDQEKGKHTLRSRFVKLPTPPACYSSRAIKKIRMSLNCSQAIFARILNVSIKTVQSWESGERSPNHAALRLLEIIDKGLYPEVEGKRKIA